MITEIGKVGVSVTTSTNIISNRIWNEDWSIAGSEPINNMPIPLNTAEGFSTVIIVSDIKLGQLIFLLKTAYTIVKHLK